ncbi:MAG: LptF/LptG family permease [Chitinophagales bacterium]|nr:LptF/LptG family permease [Chitinophagales bacterium]
MLGIKKIDKIVFVAFISPLIFTFIISEFIFLMQFLWKYIDDLVGKGLETSLLFQLLGLFSFKVIPLALPLSILLASSMVMGNFGENNEIVACKASGISTLRMMSSLIAFVLLLSVGAYFFSNRVLPYTNLKFMSLLMDIRKHKPALDIKEGIFYKGINGYTLKIGKKAANNTSIFDIIIYDHSSGYGNDNIIMAEKGEMELSADGRYMILELYGGRQYQESQKRSKSFEKLYEQNIVEFKYYRKVFDLKEFKLSRSDMSLYKGYHEMLNSSQLRVEVDSINRDLKAANNVMNDYNRGFLLYSRPEVIAEKDTTGFQQEKDSVNIAGLLMGDGPNISTINAAIANLESMQSYLQMHISDLDVKKTFKEKFEVELYKRFMLSFACIIFLLIGGAMGAIVRKGGLGMPILISVCFYMLFHVLNMTGDKLAYNRVVSPEIGSWLPAIVLLPIAIGLTYSATNDSKILKKDTYFKLINFKRLYHQN